MTAFIAWGEGTLLASAALMLLVLAVRAPVRRWIGPQLGYALWALPGLRMVLPPIPLDLLGGLPVAGPAAGPMEVLVAGPRGVLGLADASAPSWLGAPVLAVWLAGTVSLIAWFAVRHFAFCRRVRAEGQPFGTSGGIGIIVAEVEGPLAFGIRRRCIAVPPEFSTAYTAAERELAIAHECAHHRRGDLIANWASLVVLAAHWWNPAAWLAIRAFREDQELAADADVLASSDPRALPTYATVLVKAAGIGALPACNLNPRSNLKGRLMMLAQQPRSARRRLFGSAALLLIGSATLAATVATPGTAGPAAGKQAVSIGVKPDGVGGYALIVGGKAVAPGAPLPGGATLPADFSGGSDCDLKPGARPTAMAIKGSGRTTTYTIMCASAAPAPVRATLVEGLASLNTMRASVATQPASAAFPENERTHALGAIDRSIREVKATIAAIG